MCVKNYLLWLLKFISYSLNYSYNLFSREKYLYFGGKPFEISFK